MTTTKRSKAICICGQPLRIAQVNTVPECPYRTLRTRLMFPLPEFSTLFGPSSDVSDHKGKKSERPKLATSRQR